MAGKSLFSCRIVDISAYTVAPVKDLDVCYSEFRSSAVAKVPVVRIFGSTPLGQKACLHVHGVFPYIYVPCPVADPSTKYVQQLARSIDQVLQLSIGATFKTDQQHVFKITVVKGIPMYGYHDNEELFLKVYLYNPALVKRLSDLLVAGALGTVLQPHESHIPFVLQFMIDYNLYGMNFVHFSSIKLRSGRVSSERSSPARSSRSASFTSPPLLSPPPPSPSRRSSLSPSPFPPSLVPTPSQQVWDVDSLPGSMVVCVPRVSESELEVDGLAADILNKEQVSLARGSFPGLATIWEEERHRRRQLGLDAALTPPPSPGRVPESTQLLELTSALASIVEERLRRSVSPMGSSPPSLDSSVVKSCDMQSHRPIRSKESDSQSVVRQPPLASGDEREGEGQGKEPVINKEAIHQTMEMSQRLNIDTLRKSTDEELLDLLLELAQTQVGMATQPSQLLYQSQTVAHSLRSRLKRSVSSSSSSRLSRRSPSLSLTRSQPVGDTSTTGFLTGLTSSQPRAVEIPVATVEEVVESQDVPDVDKFLVPGEDLLKKSDEIDPTSKTSLTGTSTESGQPVSATSVVQLPAPHKEIDPADVPLHSPVFSDTDLFDSNFSLDPPPILPPTPPREIGGDTEATPPDEDFELSLEGENDERDNKLSVMLNSSVAIGKSGEIIDESEGGPDFHESSYDIPCAQPLSSQEIGTHSETKVSQYRARSSSTDDHSSPDNLERSHAESSLVSERSGSVGVQLEYEMPEISLSQLDVFQSATTEILGTPSKMADTKCSSRTKAPRDVLLIGSQIMSTQLPLSSSSSGSESVKGMEGVKEGADGVKEEEEIVDESVFVTQAEGLIQERMDLSDVVSNRGQSSSQKHSRTSTPFRSEMFSVNEEREAEDVAAVSESSSVSLSFSQRRMLLRRLCTTGDSGDLGDEGECEDGDGGGGEGTGCESDSEAEEESEWASGQWSSLPLTIPESPQYTHEQPDHVSQLDGRISQLASSIFQIDDSIFQLDGTPDKPQKGQPKKKSLGVRRWRTQNPSHRAHIVETVPDRSPAIVAMEQESVKDEFCLLEKGGNHPSGSSGTACIAGTDSSDVQMEIVVAAAQMKEEAALQGGTGNVESGGGTLVGSVVSATATGGSVELGGDEGRGGTPAGVLGQEMESARKRRRRGKKRRLSLSLKSNSRKRWRSRTPSSSSVQRSPPTLVGNRMNSHSLAHQWKTNALCNPPQVNIVRLPSREYRLRGIPGFKSEQIAPQTPQPASGLRESIRKRRTLAKRRLDLTKIATRPAMTKQRDDRMSAPERRQLKWAIRESLQQFREDSASSLASHSASAVVGNDATCGEASSLSVRHTTDKKHFSDSELTLSDSEATQSDTETTLSDSEATLSTTSVSEYVQEKISDSKSMPSTSPSSSSVDCGTGTSSVLEVIHDPEQTDIELAHSPEEMEVDACPSDTSSQQVESDFNLVVTESESDSDERVSVMKLGKRRRIDEDDCQVTSQRFTTSVTLSGRLSPFHSEQDIQSPFHSEVGDRRSPFHSETQGPPSKRIIRPLHSPPSAARLSQTAVSYGLPAVLHTTPFYSNPSDVQPPQEVNNKLVRIPTTMPYDLLEAEPLTLAQGGRRGIPLSATGIEHWRTVLSMLSGPSQSTKMPLPPSCHPPQEPRTKQQRFYTADDHKRDVLLRSCFFPANKKVILTPLHNPPRLKEHNVTIGNSSANVMSERNLTDMTGANLKNCENLGCPSSGSGAEGGSAGDVETETKSERGDKNPASVESELVVQSDQEQTSFTSYQIPKPNQAMDSEMTTTATDHIESENKRGLAGSPGQSVEAQHECRPVMNLTFTPAHLKRDTSQLEGPTPQNTYGFKISQSALATSSGTHEFLTSMSVELHVRTRGSLRPDPEWDPILAIFYYIHHDYSHPNPVWGHPKISILGVIAIDIGNSGFQTVHHSRQKPSPRKQPIKSPSKSPKQQLLIKVTTKSPKKQTSGPLTKITPEEPANNPQKTTNQNRDNIGSAGLRVQSSPSPVVAKGYLSECVSGEGVEVTYVSSESELLEVLVKTVQRHDPDILLGYEVTMASWGYLIDRAATLSVNLTNQLSRIPNQPGNKDRAGSGTGTRHKSSSQVHIPGRILLSVWRLMRKELALTSYTFESTFFQVMHQRVPMFSFQTLTHWYELGTHANRAEVVEYHLLRCHGNYQLLEKLNVIGRTSEFARLYGIEFENVLTRGSQYRVESMLLRLAKPANYIAVSPSVQQRARMAAPECLPLILEPESKFYSDPVVVLDFQSLYPSIVIGYNYCYTTCLGRVRNLALHGEFTLGTNSLDVPPHVLKKVKSSISISPNGVVFVTPAIRRGLMPRMLEEILGTRIMVKSSMKKYRDDKALIRMLDARQMGLKLIANVTYGYTAANFSGRMPCVEVADSIVGKARETLERAIKLITNTPEWGARVVYGDTDSVFILLKGVSKDDAFRIGKEICDRVTASNPKPVKLKFEKVYYPCILQTKKRYCGYMYETPDQKEPCYDAKGIETVRRDTCPAVAKILQKSLSLLFSSHDVSQVKSYVQRQCRKLLDGHVSIQDYILAKEYRGRGNYRPGACVPALELARRATEVDPRGEPRPGERVPYVVVYGHPGQPLIQLVRTPLEVVQDCTIRLNGVYYITKQVLPALGRALSLVGVDVYQWYSELPRVFRAPLPQLQETTNRKLKGTLGQYFATMHCPICDELTPDSMCSHCRGNPQRAATMLSQQIRRTELTHHSIAMLCQSCTRSTDPSLYNLCVSLDCPVFYRRLHTHHTLPTVTNLTKLLHTTLPQ